MKFGLMFANTGPFAETEGLVEMAQTAESIGFESLWTVEHVIWPSEYSSTYPYAPGGKMPGDSTSSIPDPLIWLAYVAASTSTIKLGTGILILPERNPLVLAKSVATLASLSKDRLILGIGVGWLKEEFEALGIPWEKRGKRTDEYMGAMRALWAEDDAHFDGEFTSFQNVTSNPKPPSGSVPIVIGGHSKAAARRAGRIGDGFFPGKGSMTELGELTDIMNQAAADAGRDPSTIEVTAGHPGLFGSDPAAAAEELTAAGVARTIIPAFALLGKEGMAEKAAGIKAAILDPCGATT